MPANATVWGCPVSIAHALLYARYCMDCTGHSLHADKHTRRGSGAVLQSPLAACRCTQVPACTKKHAGDLSNSGDFPPWQPCSRTGQAVCESLTDAQKVHLLLKLYQSQAVVSAVPPLHKTLLVVLRTWPAAVQWVLAAWTWHQGHASLC